MPVDVILNPVHPEGLRACERVQALCARAGETVTVRTTSIARPHGWPDVSAGLTVVIGGDGTVREVAGALLKDVSWQGTILPVPTGTADLFALNVGIRTPGEALELLRRHLEGVHGSRAMRCDVGWAVVQRARGRTYASGRDDASGRADGTERPEFPFLVSAGMGHSGGTLLQTPAWAKSLGGAAGYGVGALGRLWAETFPLTLREEPNGTRGAADASGAANAPGAGSSAERADAKNRRGTWAVEFGNIQTIPFGVTVFPHGGVTTGTLARLAVRFDAVQSGTRTAAWGRIFLAGFRGGHARVPTLGMNRIVAGTAVSDRPQPAHLDGEPVGWAHELHVRVEPAALPVLTSE